MRLRYGFYACPEPKCAVLAHKQIKCPKHDKVMARVVLRLERPGGNSVFNNLDDAIADIGRAFGTGKR